MNLEDGINMLHKGPSGNDIIPLGGREVQEMAIWGDFKGLTGVTRGGRGVKNLEIGVTSFMDGP